MTRDDLKKLFPNSKFPTAEELKAKEDSFSIGDRVKVSNNIRCRQHGQTGTIVRIDPEDEHNWKSFVVKFDDEKYNPMGFNSGSIDKVVEKKAGLLGLRKLAARLSKQDIQDVNTFYNTIVLPTKQEFGGIPGKDYDPKYYVKDFPLKNKLKYREHPGLNGYVTSADASNVVYLSPTGEHPVSSFVHELTHNQNRDAPSFYRDLPLVRLLGTQPATLVEHTGSSPQEDQTLTRAYKFTPKTVAEWNTTRKPSLAPLMEQAAVNRQYRYAIWKDLSEKLGHYATYDEFKDHLRGMSRDDILAWEGKPMAGYTETARANRRIGFFKDPEHKRLEEATWHGPKLPDEWDHFVSFQGNPEDFREEAWYKANPELFERVFKELTPEGWEQQRAEYQKALQAWEEARANQPKPTLLNRFKQRLGLASPLPEKPEPPQFPGYSALFWPSELLYQDRREKAKKALKDYEDAHPATDPEAFRKAWLEVARNDRPSSTSKAAEAKPMTKLAGLISFSKQAQLGATKPIAPQVAQRDQMWAGLPDAQRNAFRTWAQRGGQGKVFAQLFRGADGKVDQAAATQFLKQNPGFLTGTDDQRRQMLQARYRQLTPEQQKAFRASPQAQAYQQARQARLRQQRQQAVDARMSRYDQRRAAAQKVYDDPVGATKNWAGTAMRQGMTPQGAADATVQAFRTARSQLQQMNKGYASWVDPRTGKVVSAYGGNVDKALASGRTPPPQRRINPADFGGSALPPSLARKPQAAPQRTIDPSLRTFRQPSYARNIHGFTDRTTI